MGLVMQDRVDDSPVVRCPGCNQPMHMAFAGNSWAKGSLYWVIREDALYRLRASALALACVVSRSKSESEK